MKPPLIRSASSALSVLRVFTTAACVLVACQAHAGTLFWTTSSGGSIQRAELDGSGFGDVITGQNDLRGLALDAAGNRVYWLANTDDKLQRANLDGSGGGAGYAVFGRVVAGMDVVEKIRYVDTGVKANRGDVPIETIVIETVRQITPEDAKKRMAQTPTTKPGG